MKELSELERKIIVENAIIELRDSDKRKQIFESIKNADPNETKIIQFKRR